MNVRKKRLLYFDLARKDLELCAIHGSGLSLVFCIIQ